MNYFPSIALGISGYDILPLIFRMIDANKPSRSYLHHIHVRFIAYQIKNCAQIEFGQCFRTLIDNSESSETNNLYPARPPSQVPTLEHI